MGRITNIIMRDEIMARVSRARPAPAKRSRNGDRYTTDWTRASWLARGERAVGLVGSLAWHIVHSPKGARGSYHDCDMLLFYGPSGVLEHEEPYVQGRAPEWLDFCRG